MDYSEIINKVATEYGVQPQDILSHKRNRKISDARLMVMFILYTNSTLSVVRIAEIIGRKHSTVISGVKSMASLIQTDFETKQHFNNLYNAKLV